MGQSPEALCCQLVPTNQEISQIKRGNHIDKRTSQLKFKNSFKKFCLDNELNESQITREKQTINPSSVIERPLMNTYMIMKIINGQKSPLRKVNDTKNLGNHDEQNYLSKEKAKLSIAILIHNSRKKKLKSLLNKYADFFQNKVGTIYSTDSTYKYILKNTRKEGIFLRIPSGRLSEDKVITTKIIQGKIDAVIFLSDQQEEFHPQMKAVNSLNLFGDISQLTLIHNEQMLKSFIKICEDPHNMQIIVSRKLILQKAWKEENQYLKDINNQQQQVNQKQLRLLLKEVYNHNQILSF